MKEKQLEEMAKEKNSKQWQRRDEYCLRIQKATQYKGDCDHEDVPSILVDYEKEIKKELIPENAVVIDKEEYEELKLGNDFNYGYNEGYKNTEAYYENFKLPEVRKETAEKFAERLKSMAYQSTDWSHGEHPMVVEVDYIDEICEEITESKV